MATNLFLHSHFSQTFSKPWEETKITKKPKRLQKKKVTDVTLERNIFGQLADHVGNDTMNDDITKQQLHNFFLEAEKGIYPPYMKYLNEKVMIIKKGELIEFMLSKTIEIAYEQLTSILIESSFGMLTWDVVKKKKNSLFYVSQYVNRVSKARNLTYHQKMRLQTLCNLIINTNLWKKENVEFDQEGISDINLIQFNSITNGFILVVPHKTVRYGKKHPIKLSIMKEEEIPITGAWNKFLLLSSRTKTKKILE